MEGCFGGDAFHASQIREENFGGNSPRAVRALCFFDLNADAGHFPALISTTDLPTLNAALNFLSAVFLFTGYLFIRSKNQSAHRACMLVAFGCSILFLISYLIYHYQVGSVPFKSQGWIRPFYFTILLTHTILAIAVVPLALVTLSRALRQKFTAHRSIARWTFPIWLYVSVTGVLVYWMLYRLVSSR
jgi:putative membrane protein